MTFYRAQPTEQTLDNNMVFYMYIHVHSGSLSYTDGTSFLTYVALHVGSLPVFL